MTRGEKERLAACALEARKNAYTPYSHWAVGAALLAEDGSLFPGCNVENAAYGPTNCAERTGLFAAVAQGKREFRAIAIAGGREGEEPSDFCPPCGVCRQVMAEFCKEDFRIYMADGPEKIQSCTLAELLPYGFSAGKYMDM